MQLFASNQTALEEVINISAVLPPVEDGEYSWGKPIPWTLKKNKFTLNSENAVLENCTIK